MKNRTGVIVILFLWLISGCSPEKKEDNAPKANFSVTGYETPAPATLNFINTSSNATGYLWNFGDGSTSTSPQPTHQYNFPGSFLLSLKVTGPGGTDSICKMVSIDPALVANKSSFSYLLDKCSGYPVGAAFKTLNPASTNTVWDFGNGVTNVLRDPIVQFVVPGDYTIRYSSQINNVRDTVLRIVRIQ